MSNKGVHRTAQATLGLLKINSRIKMLADVECSLEKNWARR